MVDTIQFGETETFDQALMVDLVVTYAKHYDQGEASEDELADWAKDAVNRVWGDGVAVTKFVPMLALREVRERVLATYPQV